MTDTRYMRFLDEEGRLRQFPSKHGIRMDIYEYLSEKFEFDKVYAEREVNELLKRWSTTGDHVILRRALVDFGFLSCKRDGSEYMRVKRENTETDAQ